MRYEEEEEEDGDDGGKKIVIQWVNRLPTTSGVR